MVVGGDGQNDPAVLLRTADGGEHWQPRGLVAA